MKFYQKLLENISQIETRLRYVFKDKQLLVLAFVHRSFYNEHRKDIPEHNERLEFLGDSVLSILVSQYLYQELPSSSEGHLSSIRSTLVDAPMCVKFMQKLSLEEFILLGKGELMNEGKHKESIQSDLFEAVLGAIFLDGGFSAVKEFFWSHFQEDVEKRLKDPVRNWKADLQDYSQKKYQKAPSYHTLQVYGPDHSKKFEVAAYLDGQEMGRGKGSSKKEAEQEAAKSALQSIEQS